jgi:hypothetical protein
MDIVSDKTLLIHLGDGGLAPTAADLASAPYIDDWSVDMFGRGFRVVGIVTGHPRLPDGPVATSSPVHADLDRGWLKTHSRFYRLGWHKDDVAGSRP